MPFHCGRNFSIKIEIISDKYIQNGITDEYEDKFSAQTYFAITLVIIVSGIIVNQHAEMPDQEYFTQEVKCC